MGGGLLRKMVSLKVKGPKVAASVAADPPCCWDSFTEDHRRVYDTAEKLLSVESKQELSVALTLATGDIVRIEARHATLRHAVLRSIQTYRRTFSQLASDFFLLQQRRLERGPWAPLESNFRRSKKRLAA